MSEPGSQQDPPAKRHRVMFFCPTLGEGGADRAVLNLLHALDRQTFEPILVMLNHRGALDRDIPSDIQVRCLHLPRLMVAAPFLAREMRRVAPSVVFSSHGAANLIVCLAHLIARSKARLVLSERSAIVRSDRSVLRRAVELPAKRMLYRRADLVTAVSAGVAADLEGLVGVVKDRVMVVTNPIVSDELHELARHPCEHAWFQPGIQPPLLAVGRLVDIKDYPTIIEALIQIRQRRAVRLAILGDGPLRRSLEQLVEQRGLGDAVAFLGFDKNPYRYMSRAALLIHGSRAEGLPAVLIQAMACGAPVVSTDCDHGPREIIDHPGVNGFLVPVGDATALARAALRILEDENLRQRIIAAGRASAERYSYQRATALYEAAIVGAST